MCTCIRGTGFLHSIAKAIGHNLVKFSIETFRRRSRVYLDPPFLPASLAFSLLGSKDPDDAWPSLEAVSR